MMDLNMLRQANLERDAEWDLEHKITLEFRTLELAGEVGEFCNSIKKKLRESLGLRGSRVEDSEIAAELADIMICLDLVAMHLGVDFSEIVPTKFNDTSKTLGLKTFMPQIPARPGQLTTHGLQDVVKLTQELAAAKKEIARLTAVEQRFDPRC